MIPEQIRHYQLKEPLGRGGMGAVYKAWDLNLEREVALKMIHPELLSNQDMLRRFRQEVETLKKLEHSAIVPVYDFGGFHLDDEEPSVIDPPFLVMRFMSGGSLSERIRREAITLEEAVRIMERVAAALDAVHEKDLIHRDITPRNIFFDSYGEAYLGDFGLVKSLGADDRTMSTVGTYAYMSPEQFTGKDISSQSDIYALGGVLYTMLTSQRPYQDYTTLSAILNAHQNEPPPDVLEANPHLPRQINAIIHKAMAKNPEDRYQTAQEMVTQLKFVAENPFAVLDENQNEFTRVFTQTIAEPLPKTKPAIPRLYFALAGITAVVLLLVGGWLVWGNTAEPPPVAQVTPSPMPTQPVLQVTIPPTERPTEAPYSIYVSRFDSSAIWQTDGGIQRIPDDQTIEIPFGQTVRFQSDREQLVLNLPGQIELHILPDTELQLAIPADDDPIRVTPLEGRFAIVAASDLIEVEIAENMVASVQDGQLGIGRSGLANRVEVDCLTGFCQISEGFKNTTLTMGEQLAVASNRQPLTAAGINYGTYASLKLVLPTATAVATNTPTPTATPSVGDVLASSPDVATIEFGQSVNGKPLEVVRIGSGPRRVLFVGGIHAGYGLHAVQAAEESVAYFSTNRTEIPADITLYVVLNLNPDSPEAEGEIPGRLNANGVDLNRNWDCRWTADPTIAGETVIDAGGVTPFSEPEVLAFRDLVEVIQPKAVIFWGSHARANGYVSPGLCIEENGVSVPLASYYGEAAGYGYPLPPVPINESITGDVSNWLDLQEIPSVFVLLSRQQEFELGREIDGMKAVLSAVSNNTVQEIPTVRACSLGVSAKWRESLGSREEGQLGCGLTGVVESSAGAYQYYDNGLMIWREDNSTVYVLYGGGDGFESIHIDPNLDVSELYRETQDLRGAFGFLWTNNTSVRERLGEPNGTEQVASEFVYQDFESGFIYSFRIDNVERTFVLIELDESQRWFEP